MNSDKLKKILEQLASHEVTVDDVYDQLRQISVEDLEYAKLDHQRHLRCGMPEVIYCPNKTTPQITEIFSRLAAKGENVLATRTTEAVYASVVKAVPNCQFDHDANAIFLKQTNMNTRDNNHYVAVVTAGTSDIPVAKEAVLTITLMHQPVEEIYDVGVAGIERLLSKVDILQRASAIVAIAGMEGALPSVIGGLVSVPVIAVPTSVGYGANFEGVAPLLTMLNSCAAGVSVVNIDNGFSAGYIAATIARQCVHGK